MIAAVALVMMAAQARAVPAEPIVLDLAAITAGPVHRIAVAGEQPFPAELVNRLPGAAYVVAQTLQSGGGSSVGLNPSRPDDPPLRSWRDTEGCGDVVPRAGGLFAATEETQVGGLLAVGSPLQAALAHCPARNRSVAASCA
jgi:hypothetical protein